MAGETKRTRRVARRIRGAGYENCDGIKKRSPKPSASPPRTAAYPIAGGRKQTSRGASHERFSDVAVGGAGGVEARRADAGVAERGGVHPVVLRLPRARLRLRPGDGGPGAAERRGAGGANQLGAAGRG